MPGTSQAEPPTDAAHVVVKMVSVIIVAIALFASSALAPATATEGGDDLESVRAEVIETYNYKIGLLANRKADTSNPDRQAIYQAGIDELTSIRDTSVATASSVDELWALRDTAHAIYHATVDAASAVPLSPEEELEKAKSAARGKVGAKIAALEDWIEGCDDPEAQAIVAAGIADLRALYPLIEDATSPDEAYAIKARAHEIYEATLARATAAKGTTDEDDGKADEEDEAARQLADARRATLSLIDRRAAMLRSAAAAARVPAVVELYALGAEDVLELRNAAKSARIVRELTAIQAEVEEIFEATKTEAAAVRDGVAPSPEETVSTYLDHLVAYVTNTTEAAASTAEESPETFEALVAAKRVVLERVDSVREVADTGSRLDTRWEALDESLAAFRYALVLHYVALGDPTVVGGIQIPG